MQTPNLAPIPELYVSYDSAQKLKEAQTTKMMKTLTWKMRRFPHQSDTLRRKRLRSR